MTSIRRTAAAAGALLLLGMIAAQAQTAGQCWDPATGQVRDRRAAATSGADGHDGQDVPADASGSIATPRNRSTAPMPSGVPTTGATGSTASGGGANRPAAAAGLPNC